MSEANKQMNPVERLVMAQESEVEIKKIPCPDCSSEETGDLDCPDCLGGGQHQEDEDELCESCDGAGYVEGTMECFDCGNEFDAP